MSAESHFQMADKNDRIQGKRIPRDFLNNLSSVDLFYEEKSWNETSCKKMLGFVLGRAADSNKTVRGCSFRDIFVTILFQSQAW